MGRGSYSDRFTADECKSISVVSLRRDNFLDGIRRGIFNWSRTGVNTGSAYLTVSTMQGAEHIQFQYVHINRLTGEETNLDYKVILVSTPCNFGGRRWWFICPCSSNGRYCGRRVGVLYWIGKYFACRHCHRLVYETSRNHRSFYEGFSRRFAISDKYKKICAGKGRKGFSKREWAQIAKLIKKTTSLPEFPPKPVIVRKTIIVNPPLKKDRRP